MTIEEAKKLLARYEEGTCTADEAATLEAWYDQRLANSDLSLSNDEKSRYKIQIFDQINHRIATIGFRRNHSWLRIALPAAAAAIAIGLYILYPAMLPKSSLNNEKNFQTNDAISGKSGATLTLANGKSIQLGNQTIGNIADQDGVTIAKSTDGKIIYEMNDDHRSLELKMKNTLETAKGQTYQIRLPDGTDVWLNAASSISYIPSLLVNGKRIVWLKGEGYFEVAKDKVHPFIVKTSKQDLEVLGTHFNINSYPDEPAIVTTLVEGSVKITSQNKQARLTPGHQSVNDGNSIKIETVSIESVTDWKDGDFNLNGVDFKTAMRKIARWYNVEVIFNDDLPKDILSTGMISRNKKLSSILDIIEASGQVKFKIAAQKVYVSPN